MRTLFITPPDYPPTRFMGSKLGILPAIWDAVKHLPFTTVLDAFSGSGCVSYMFKGQGKAVIANDFLKYSYHMVNALVANTDETLTENDVEMSLGPNADRQNFIQETFQNLYFSEIDNLFLDNTIANIQRLTSPFKRSLALTALNRACIKRRPRGVFTYTGQLSDNDYLRRYHFVEGLSCYWQGVEILHHTKTKKLRKYYTPFDSRTQVHSAFEHLLQKFSNSIIIVSYSSNSLPTREELTEMLKAIKGNVIVHIIGHKYSFGTHSHKVGNQNNSVQEYLFVAY